MQHNQGNFDVIGGERVGFSGDGVDTVDGDGGGDKFVFAADSSSRFADKLRIELVGWFISVLVSLILALTGAFIIYYL